MFLRGEFLDLYNQAIRKKIAGTLRVGVFFRNSDFITIKKNGKHMANKENETIHCFKE